ncbi:probable cytochrome P450 313a4 [Drosophila albomicans]|uniref:Probable cytochrome P450 313a4 n=1 Tax=Drosophila albomicans TaxID=7291 RepID=A0A6P8XX32_DROAB|nr:probable cytochrome P450 313a4 [Drosophila albomicans]
MLPWITLLVGLWIYVIWSRRRLYQLMLRTPGPRGYPIIGNLHQFWIEKGFLRALAVKIQKYGTAWLGWFGPFPVYFVTEPSLVQDLLTAPHALSKGKIAYHTLEELLGSGVLVLDDPKWSKHRKVLNPAFGPKVLLSFIPIFNNEGGSLIRELDNLVGKGENEMLSYMKNFTLRIATQTTLGSDVKEEEIYKNETLMEKYQSCTEAGIEMILKPWLGIQLFRCWTNFGKLVKDSNSTIRNFINKMIDNKLEQASRNNQPEVKTNSFVNLAIDQLKNQVFNYQNVADEANTIVFAAFETTALTITYTLMHLAMFPEYQERVFEEIKSVFPNTGDFEVAYEDLQNLEYLGMVINESLRLMPALPLSLRKVTEDVKLSNGVVLPKGLQFCIGIFHMHRNKDIWGPEADMFNPDNCLPRSLQDKHPYAFIPFLKGKRNCIGWRYALISMKITLIKILRNYKLTTKFRFEDLEFVDSITLKLKKLPGLQLDRRN